MGKLHPWLRFIEGEDGAASAPESPESTDTDQDTDQDWKAKYEAMKAVSRKWEDRAKANRDAADKLKSIEDAQKSDMDRLRDELDKAVAARDQAAREALRLKVAATYGLSAEDADLFLTADTEERMTEQAKRLAAMGTKRKYQPLPGGDADRTPPAPDLKSGADLFNRVKNNL